MSPVVDQSVGPIVTATEIRAGALATLQLWMPSILAEIARRNDIGDPDAPLDHNTGGLRVPRTWTRPVGPTALTADQTPCVVVTSAGVDDTERSGDEYDMDHGNWAARWVIIANVIIRASSFDEVADHIGYYTAAARVALMQHGVGVTGAGRPRWLGETYHELDTTKARSIGGGAVRFHVTADDVLNDLAGPSVPPVGPIYDDPDDQLVTENPTISIEPMGG